MGLYYSHGILQLDRYPSFMETFEILIGVDVPPDRNRSKNSEEKEIAVPEQPSSSRANRMTVGSHHDVQSETSVRIAVDFVSSQMKRE